MPEERQFLERYALSQLTAKPSNIKHFMNKQNKKKKSNKADTGKAQR